jgi:uncharacterized protein (TIGR02271 family)
MSRTVTALFDSRPEAEAAKARLASSSIDADNVRIIDKSSSGSSEGHGFWASLKDMFIPEEDRFAYGEGISRGGFLLCAQVDEDQADQAVSILDESDSVDFDQRQQDWRSEGWQGYQADAGTFGTASSQLGGERSNIIEEEHIPIVEEELRVGKREVTRGGARVRSFVREIPVHEQVNLREEHVSVERRPVDQTLNAGDVDTGDMLRERNIEMTETAEEAVVAKEARVREELVVRKTSEQRTENIDDTVRRTEVEVDDGMAGSQDRSAFGSFGQGGSQSEPRTDAERTDFARTERDKSF